MGRTAMVAAIAAAAAVLALAPAGSAAAATGRDGSRDQVVVSGDVDVPAGRAVGTVWAGDADVRVAGTAHDVYVLTGDVRVSGRVVGNVVVVSGRASVTNGGRVGGDVRSGKSPRVARGARVGGDVDEIDGGLVGALNLFTALLLWLAVSVSTLLLGIVLIVVAPQAVAALTRVARARPGACASWGLVAAITAPLVALVALVSLVGIPFGVGLLLAMGVVSPIGYVVGAMALGSTLLGPTRPAWLAFGAGWGLLRVAALTPWLGVAIWVAASVYGLGAVVLAVAQTRRRPAPAPA